MSKTTYLLIFSVLLLSAACKTTKPDNKHPETGKTAFIPYSVGTFWAYEYIDHQNEGAASYFDTIRVLSHEKTEEGLKVNLNQGKWMVKAGGDSIFNFCQSRGGGGFAMPLYHRTNEPSTYSSCKGDVVMEVVVSKMADAQVVKGKTYKNCYLYELKPYERVIVAEGVGVIKKEFFGINNKLATEQLLVSYGVK